MNSLTGYMPKEQIVPNIIAVESLGASTYGTVPRKYVLPEYKDDFFETLPYSKKMGEGSDTFPQEINIKSYGKKVLTQLIKREPGQMFSLNEIGAECSTVPNEQNEKIVLRAVIEFISKGYTSEARRYLSLLKPSEADSPKIYYWRKVLAEPMAKPAQDATGGDIKKDLIWLKENSSKYSGKWVAIKNGTLVGSDSSRIILRNKLKVKEQLKGTMFFQCGN